MIKNSPKILFNKQAIPYVLDIFGAAINGDGLIINADSGDLILDPDKEPISSKEFGGIKKGSEIFFKNDIATILNLAEGKF